LHFTWSSLWITAEIFSSTLTFLHLLSFYFLLIVHSSFRKLA
jgi:hypothetical protein